MCQHDRGTNGVERWGNNMHSTWRETHTNSTVFERSGVVILKQWWKVWPFSSLCSHISGQYPRLLIDKRRVCSSRLPLHQTQVRQQAGSNLSPCPLSGYCNTARPNADTKPYRDGSSPPECDAVYTGPYLLTFRSNSRLHLPRNRAEETWS